MNAPHEVQQMANKAGDTADLLPVTVAIAEYDRTLPLIDGRVKADGLALQITPALIGDFCHRPIYEQYDVAEMSLSWYVAARCRGEPVIALPVFPLRMAVLGYLFCRADAPFTHPHDLIGKRIATKQYRLTVNLWLRGLLNEHYGVAPEQLQWVTREPEGADFVVPQGIRKEIVRDRTAEELLLAGEVDAIIGATVPPSFLRGDPRIRRLFPDARAEMRDFVARTGIFPITHTIVMGESYVSRRPEVARSVVAAFNEAQRVSDAFNAEPKHSSMPESVFVLEEQRIAYGLSPWAQGLQPNRHVLETFVRYAREQGYIARMPEVGEMFFDVLPS